jgi:hypothetical protein
LTATPEPTLTPTPEPTLTPTPTPTLDCKYASVNAVYVAENNQYEIDLTYEPCSGSTTVYTASGAAPFSWGGYCVNNGSVSVTTGDSPVYGAFCS